MRGIQYRDLFILLFRTCGRAMNCCCSTIAFRHANTETHMGEQNEYNMPTGVCTASATAWKRANSPHWSTKQACLASWRASSLEACRRILRRQPSLSRGRHLQSQPAPFLGYRNHLGHHQTDRPATGRCKIDEVRNAKTSLNPTNETCYIPPLRRFPGHKSHKLGRR